MLDVYRVVAIIRCVASTFLASWTTKTVLIRKGTCLRHSYWDRVIPFANESFKQTPLDSLPTSCRSWKSCWEIHCDLFDLVCQCYVDTSVVWAVEVENRNWKGRLSNPCDLHTLLRSCSPWNHVQTRFWLNSIDWKHGTDRKIAVLKLLEVETSGRCCRLWLCVGPKQ